MGARGPRGQEEERVVKLGLAPPKERPRAPEWMKEGTRARDTWDRVVNSLPADHFRQGELPLLEKYCMAEEIYYQAAERMSGTLTITTAKGYELPDTYLTIMNKQVTIQSMLATKLRLTPNSRISNNKAGHSKEEVPTNSMRQGLMFGGSRSE